MKPDPRTPFDSVPETFDRWRPRYCATIQWIGEEVAYPRCRDLLRPDCRAPFFGGIRAAIERHGGVLEVVGAYILYLWAKDAP